MTTRGIESDRREDSKSVGLSMAEVLTLPNQQRKIVQWMMKRSNEDVDLGQVAAHIGESEQATLEKLDDLVEQGFVQETQAGGGVSYRIRLAAKRGIQQENIIQALAPGNPLAVILNPSGDLAVKTGARFEVCVTVTNKGAGSALIDIFIDELSGPLVEWCASPRERLALGVNSTSEVFFEFQIPVTAAPGTYNYTLVVDAPLHYPEDTPIRHSAKVQVLPAIETVVRVSDPTFTLIPPTSSRSPAQIPPGAVLQVNAIVHNRSDRVDRFRLTCPDLDETWFTVRYPEGLETAGLITPNLGLDLNPGDKGEILLLFNPPLGAVSSRYYPTIRLYSANNPDLVLLDVVYLEILPSYLLNVELLTLVGRVRRLSGVYEVRLSNAGNTSRSVVLRVVLADEEDLCTYTVAPVALRVLPGDKATSQVTLKPRKWWRRPIFGAGRLINFRVELEDQDQSPLPNASPQGTLIWEPRPWWQFLLVVLATLGAIAAIAFLIWWLFFRPPAQPKILQFNSGDNFYQEADGDFIALNWQIRNPRQLQSLSITGLSPDGTAAVQPTVYTFNGRVPAELKQFCQMAAVLTCRNVRTDARKAGDYVFEIKAFSKKNPDAAADVLKTSTIKIAPIEPPKILEFSSAKPVYQEVAGNVKPVGQPIGINPPAVNQPVAENSPGFRKPGENFRAVNSVTPLRVSPDTIRVNWRINDLEQIKELRVIGRSPEGTITSQLKRYDFSKGFPKELEAFCPQRKTELICSNVPTNNQGSGDYIYELLLFSKTATDKPTDTKKTDVIKVQAKPSKIVQLQINGREALPKYLIPINETKPVGIVNFSWKVEGGKNIKVELLPSPGNVPPAGSIPYPISQKPSSETIILQVTNSAGDRISRSVTIETFLPPPPAPIVPPTAGKPNAATTGSGGKVILPPPPPTLKPAAPPVLQPAAPIQVPAAAVLPPPPPGQASPPAPQAATPPGVAPPQGTSSPAPTPTPTATPAASPNPLAPAPSQPGTLSPSELPPRFD